MMIHEITEQVGPHTRRKRVGRGRATGSGKTSGRGQKGATSRSGWSFRPGYEGGQKPFAQRAPKRGFNNSEFATLYHVVNLKALEARCDDGASISVESLAKLGLVRDTRRPLKILAEGDLTKKFTIVAAKCSAAAKTKIEASGGTLTIVEKKTWKRAPKTTSKSGAKAATKSS